mgnify:CR=1 FL=1|tara:strand:- start:5121 stop:5582 length:462 start_codon:yes stop_codon:yes gene_type:complete
MTLGNILRERDEQYIANRDETGTWRILDTWHDALKSISPDDDVEDSNEAVTVIKEGAFISLMKEAGRLGILENASDSGGQSNSEVDEIIVEYNASKDKIAELQKQLAEYKGELSQTRVYSEHSHIKEKAMDTVLKLAGMDTLVSQRFNDLGKD